MGTLRDEAYEKLDYLSQLTEIVVSPQNELLGRLPDKLELKLEDIKRLKYKLWYQKTSFELTLSAVLGSLVTSEEYQYMADILPHFQLQVSDDLEIDFIEKTMVGSIYLVKINPQIEEKKLLEIAVDRASRQMNSYVWSGKRMRERAVTVLNTMQAGRGTAWLQNVNGTTKYSAEAEIKALLSELILDNKWRIRNADTIVKVGKWIDSYMSGAEIGLINLLKLKIMVDKDLPIYSVDEVTNVDPA